MYIETENTGLSPLRVFSSLHYMDEQHTRDEYVSHSFIFLQSIATERIPARFEGPSHISSDSVDMRPLFQVC